MAERTGRFRSRFAGVFDLSCLDGGCNLFEQLKRLRVISWTTVASSVKTDDLGLASTVVLGGSLLVPLPRLRIVLWNAEAVFVEPADLDHGFAVVLGRSLLVPLPRFRIIL